MIFKLFLKWSMVTISSFFLTSHSFATADIDPNKNNSCSKETNKAVIQCCDFVVLEQKPIPPRPQIFLCHHNKQGNNHEQ